MEETIINLISTEEFRDSLVNILTKKTENTYVSNVVSNFNKKIKSDNEKKGESCCEDVYYNLESGRLITLSDSTKRMKYLSKKKNDFYAWNKNKKLENGLRIAGPVSYLNQFVKVYGEPSLQGRQSELTPKYNVNIHAYEQGKFVWTKIEGKYYAFAVMKDNHPVSMSLSDAMTLEPVRLWHTHIKGRELKLVPTKNEIMELTEEM